MARCFVTRRLPGPALDRLRAQHEVEVWPGRLPPSAEELAARAADAEGLLTLLTENVDAALIEHCPDLRAISNYAVGYDNIDLEAATARGIPVGNTPDVLTDATADLTFALLLAAARKLPEAIADVRDGDWLTWEPGQLPRRRGQRRDARDRRARTNRAGGGAARLRVRDDGPACGQRLGSGVALETLLERSDFVSLHCPLTPETYHLIDAAALASMRTERDPDQHRPRPDRRPGRAAERADLG